MFSLSGKTAIITGGGNGIGEKICQVFSKAGASIHILDIHASQAEKVEKSITERGGTAKAWQVDVSQQARIVEVCNQIQKSAGQIDILINNAGIAQIGNLHTTSEKELDKVIQVNIKGVYNGMFAAIQHMRKKQQGVILNMASVASLVGLPDRFGYSMTKGAVLNMTLTVARDYVREGIRCNSISPARVHTPLVDGYLAQHYPGQEKEMYDQLANTQPIGRMAKPEEIAWLALYLCSDEASFITGTNFPIDGGFLNLSI
ncbi:MAG: SDR family oxidoreductase [Bacteroidota bacterium]